MYIIVITCILISIIPVTNVLLFHHQNSIIINNLLLVLTSINATFVHHSL